MSTAIGKFERYNLPSKDAFFYIFSFTINGIQKSIVDTNNTEQKDYLSFVRALSRALYSARLEPILLPDNYTTQFQVEYTRENESKKYLFTQNYCGIMRMQNEYVDFNLDYLSAIRAIAYAVSRFRLDFSIADNLYILDAAININLLFTVY